MRTCGPGVEVVVSGVDNDNGAVVDVLCEVYVRGMSVVEGWSVGRAGAVWLSKVDATSRILVGWIVSC